MATHNFTWKIDSYDNTSGIATVTYTSSDDSSLPPLTITLKPDHTDIANSVIYSAPVQDWERIKSVVDANTILTMTGTSTKTI
jgi:hypothetical protein